MSDITEEALNTIEDSFGTRFVRHAPGEGEPHAEQPFGSVFPESAEEVESLMKLASRHSIPLIARGAGTAPYSGKMPRVLVVRFDGMRNIRLPESSREDWVEVEPGVTWLILGNRLREKGMGPRVYSTPRALRDPPSAAGWPRTGWG
jgi:FAD/FMN-containing dehydrogenase